MCSPPRNSRWIQCRKRWVSVLPDLLIHLRVFCFYNLSSSQALPSSCCLFGFSRAPPLWSSFSRAAWWNLVIFVWIDWAPCQDPYFHSKFCSSNLDWILCDFASTVHHPRIGAIVVSQILESTVLWSTLMVFRCFRSRLRRLSRQTLVAAFEPFSARLTEFNVKLSLVQSLFLLHLVSSGSSLLWINYFSSCLCFIILSLFNYG